MQNQSALQVFSNSTDDLVLMIDGDDVEVLEPSDEPSKEPMLFLFAPLVQLHGNRKDDVRVWLEKTRNLISVYHKHCGSALMFSTQILQQSPSQILDKINESLTAEQPLSSVSLSYQNENALWALVFEAEIRSNINSFSVIEEALALCTPIEGQEQFEQQAINELATEASQFLQHMTSSYETEIVRCESISQARNELALELQKSEQTVRNQCTEISELVRKNSSRVESAKFEAKGPENELLLLQIQQMQEELEYIDAEFSVFRNKIKSETMGQRIQSLWPLPRSTIKNYHHLLFDRTYYCEQGGWKTMPVMDYKYRGWKKGWDPHPLFDSRFYLKQIEQTLESLGMSPLNHYLTYGVRLNLSTHPEFDAKWYYEEYVDVAEHGVPSLIHFVAHGMQEGRKPNPEFDGEWYVNRYKDVAESGMNPLIHYVRYGKDEDRGRNAADLSQFA